MKVGMVESIIKDVMKLANEESEVAYSVRKHLERTLFKHRSDIKELKKIIMLPRLHQKYV